MRLGKELETECISGIFAIDGREKGWSRKHDSTNTAAYTSGK